MSIFIACVFPIILVILLLRFFPANIPLKNSVGQLEDIGNTEPLTYSEHLKYGLPMLVAVFAVAYPLGLFQHVLLELAGNSTAWHFSHRGTDVLIYSFIPGFFLSFIVVFPFYLRLLVRYLGDRIYDMLDRPDRSNVPMTLHQELQLMPKMSIAIGVAATLLNITTFDTFLQIRENRVRYSAFFSFVTHEISIGEISKAIIYSHRLVPNGQIKQQKYLEFRMNNGETIDTFYLIEDDHIPEVVNALMQAGSRNIDVQYYKGHKT